MNITPLLQNDDQLRVRPSIAPYGCFVTSLREIAERHVGVVLTGVENVEMYDWLVANGHVLDEVGRQAYVNGHAAVVNAALYYLDAPQTAKYVGAVYIPATLQHRTWGSLASANYFIGQGRFEGIRNSHFYESEKDGSMRWNPWWPTGSPLQLLSIRGFRL